MLYSYKCIWYQDIICGLFDMIHIAQAFVKYINFLLKNDIIAQF